MAVVTNVIVEDGKVTLHPTHVDAHIKISTGADRPPIIQIDTLGSENRQLKRKVSQTLQFERKSAEELFHLLRRVYGFK